jgi:hypothetical protein
VNEIDDLARDVRTGMTQTLERYPCGLLILMRRRNVIG